MAWRLKWRNASESIPFSVTSRGVLEIPDMFTQTTLCIPKVHSVVLSETADISIEQVIDMTALPIVSGQVPQLDAIILYRSVEQLEFTSVQLKISCSGLTPINWILVGGGRGSVLTKQHNIIS